MRSAFASPRALLEPRMIAEMDKARRKAWRTEAMHTRGVLAKYAAHVRLARHGDGCRFETVK